MDVISGGVTAWVALETVLLGSPVLGLLMGSAGMYTLIKGVRGSKRR